MPMTPPPAAMAGPGMGQGSLAGLLEMLSGQTPTMGLPTPPAAMPGLASGFPPEQGAGPEQASLLALLTALMGSGGGQSGMMPGAPPAMPGAMPGGPPMGMPPPY
jgi:hypothetical protein